VKRIGFNDSMASIFDGSQLGFAANAPLMVVRKNIRHEKKFYADSLDGVNRIEWNELSSVMPGRHRRSLASRLLRAVETAEKATKQGVRFLSIVVVLKNGGTGFEYENNSAEEIAATRNEIFANIPKLQKLLPDGTNMAIVAWQVGLVEDGRTRPHCHFLLSVDPSVEMNAGDLIAVLQPHFGDCNMMIVKGYYNNKSRYVPAHAITKAVSYIFSYPLSIYDSDIRGAKLNLKSWICAEKRKIIPAIPGFFSLVTRSLRAAQTIKFFGYFRANSACAQGLNNSVSNTPSHSHISGYGITGPLNLAGHTAPKPVRRTTTMLCIKRKPCRLFPDMEITYAVFVWGPKTPPSQREIEQRWPELAVAWRIDRAEIRRRIAEQQKAA
jgi:hypothetical protein